MFSSRPTRPILPQRSSERTRATARPPTGTLVTDRPPPDAPAPFPGWQPPPAGPEPDRSTGIRLRTLARFAVPVVVVGLGLVGYLGQADRDDSGAIVGAGSVAAEDLRVGDCFDDDGGDATDDVTEIADVAAIPCGDPHDNEVFHVFELEGDELPSDEAIFELVGSECLPAFSAFVGSGYETSELDLFPIWPTEVAWKAGDRTVRCSLYAMDGSKLEGSARDSRR
jgi:hypothetical protein